MERPHRKRCKRYNIEGQPHCLTFSCFRGQPFLLHEQARGWMAEALSAERRQGLYDLWAYVLMPEHVHLVLLPHGETTISRILASVKSSVAKRALRWAKENSPALLQRMAHRTSNAGCHYRFWLRGGGYDRNLRSVHDIYEKIKYTHANPVRRGLVAAPEDWYWSSCRAWQTGEDIPIVIDRDSLPW
ncbi:MAG: transposase [Sedimentisphaerales bacterium]|nr:transposase [Sedimentisphaerales bacterium]